MKNIDETQKTRLITDWKENDPQCDNVDDYVAFLEKNIQEPSLDEIGMFDFKARREVFEPLIGISDIFANEILMELSLDGFHVRTVDPAHVAMVDVTLDVHGCEQFFLENLEGCIGLDTTKVLNILKQGTKEDVFSFEYDGEELYVRYGNIRRKVGTVPFDNLGTPRLPKFNSLGEALTDPREVVKALKGAEKVADSVDISIRNKIFRIHAEGDVDTVNVPIPCATYGEGAGYYSIDYMKDIFKALAKYHFQQCRIGTGESRKKPMPLRVYAGGNLGSINSLLSIEILLAPRIESE